MLRFEKVNAKNDNLYRVFIGEQLIAFCSWFDSTFSLQVWEGLELSLSELHQITAEMERLTAERSKSLFCTFDE